jgi:predicted regulator of Ras-like GTPase activity (Roadblock/LC7/MglB family)
VVGQLVTVTPDRPERRIELADAVAGARAAARFDVIAPRKLPKGWVANSARFGPDAWHLGVLTPQNRYIGLEQAATSAAGVVGDFAPKSRAAGAVRLNGTVWQVRTESDGDRVYVRDVGKTSVLVIGSAPRAELERYVSSLSSAAAES